MFLPHISATHPASGFPQRKVFFSTTYAFLSLEHSNHAHKPTAQIYALVNFAKSGTPSAENLPQWEPYTRETGATMLLDDTSTLTHNHDKELIASLATDYKY